jgi:predicted Rossmann fold nucleotide-binding protein DprA/Smf involved in DNA uptake
MTKRENFAILRSLVADNAELVAFIDHEVELLDKKNTKSGAPTKKQIQNNAIKDTLLSVMSDTPMTISEIQALVPSGEEMSNQKISALLTALKNDGKVVRTVDKRVAYFAKA